MRKIAIDIGNTRIKLGIFKQKKLLRSYCFDSDASVVELLQLYRAEDIIYSSVRRRSDPLHTLLDEIGALALHAGLVGLCLKVDYRSPETLGADRIAAAAGALYLRPNCHNLVISIGTCLSYTLLDSSSRLLGGAISPGLRMRLRSMAEQTSELPLVDLETLVRSRPPLLGRSTVECLGAGVWQGTEAEIRAMIEDYAHQYPGLGVFLCGGDAQSLQIRTPSPIVVSEELILLGLRHILSSVQRN